MGMLDKLQSLFKPSSKKKAKSNKRANIASPKKPQLKVLQGGAKNQTHADLLRIQNQKDKAEIALYQQKIAKKLKDDPHAQKRAAMIIHKMIS